MARGALRLAGTSASNVIALNAPQHRQPLQQRLAAHARLFTVGRRGRGDVFWLKENAEFLNILECTGQPGDPVLEAYEPIYDKMGELMRDFPQYYRFHLSICLDLEALGMPGDKAEPLCAWVVRENLVAAELSDLQRAEADRLLARRGMGAADESLRERLHGFAGRSRTFALPNRKAAYELTHVVFYLSEYGRCDPGLGAGAEDSLVYLGLLAFLDQDMDLLAEICIALRCMGATPSPLWEEAVRGALSATIASETRDGDCPDDYHAYLVANWLAGCLEGEVMPAKLTQASGRFDMPLPVGRPLQQMSRCAPRLQSDAWHDVRGHVLAQMDRGAQAILQAAEWSTEAFEEFYAIFARTAHPLA